MKEAVKFDKVLAEELLEEVSFSIPEGSIAAVVSTRREEGEQQLRLALGLTHPSSGSVTLIGEDPGGVTEKALAALRRQVAVVYRTGGLISNLKVWENLVLPLEYFSLYPPDEIEERGSAALARVGYTGGLMELPGHLSLYARRQVGLARALLLDPRLVIYDDILTGLSAEQRSALAAVVEAFHRESPGRTSLFFTADDEAVREIPVEIRIAGTGSSAHD